MSALAKEAREKMKAKARSLASEKVQKVDSSDWTPAEPLNADVKTGLRPISKRQFKRGGKVIGKAAGEASAPRADRKPRKSGGRVEKDIGIGIANKNMKEANQSREGVKHIGGLKKGGRIKKDFGGTIKNLATSGILGLGGKLLGDAAKRSDDERDQSNWRNAQMIAAMPRKSGGKAKRAAGGGVKDKQALGAIDPSPKRGAAQHYKKGGKIKKADGGSFLQRLVGGGEKEKREREMRDVGKSQTSNYSQEDKGALNRMLRKDDALPAPDEAMQRSGKFQDYKRGGKAKRASGGRMDADYVGAASVTKGGKPVTRPKDIEDREPREPRASDLYSGEQLKRLERGYKKGGSPKKWIGKAIEKPGALRKSLGVKKGETIPEKKLEAASEKGGKLGKRARLAETLKRMNRKTGGPVPGGTIDIGEMKKGPKAKKGGKTDINITINTKPAGDAGLPPMPPMPQGVPIPMGGPAGAPPAAAGAPMGMPPAPPAMPPAAPPPGPMPRKRGGRVGKYGGGAMGPGFKGSMPAGAQSTLPPAPAPQALPPAPMQQQAMQQFRPGAPINIAGPGIQPMQNLQIRPGATAPVRPMLPQQQAPVAAAPAAAAAPAGPSAADQAAAVMRNMYVARAMGLMRKAGGRVK